MLHVRTCALRVCMTLTQWLSDFWGSRFTCPAHHLSTASGNSLIEIACYSSALSKDISFKAPTVIHINVARWQCCLWQTLSTPLGPSTHALRNTALTNIDAIYSWNIFNVFMLPEIWVFRVMTPPSFFLRRT